MAGLMVVLGSGWTLAIRNIRIQMREHLLGYAWTLIIPMIYAVCYIIIKRELSGDIGHSGVDSGRDALRAFTGITLFQCWIQVVQDMANIIRRQKGMLRGLNIGPSPFVLAIMFEGLIALAVRVFLIVAAMPVLGLSLPAGLQPWILFAVSLVVLHMSACAIGLVLAPWATLYGDVRKGLQSISLPLILISPIFYAATQNYNSMLYWLNAVNPLASPLALLADALHGKFSLLYLMPVLVWWALSAVFILWSLALLRRHVPVLLERLGS